MNLAGEKMLSKQRRAQVEMVLVASEGVTTGYAVDARADICMLSSETISKCLEQTLLLCVTRKNSSFTYFYYCR